MSALLLLVFSAVVISTGCFAEHVYYVTPSLNKACPSTVSSETCQTLGHYVNKSDDYFQSDTTFFFLSGIHWLNVEELVTIKGITGLRMIGDSQLVPSSQSFLPMEPSTVISCNTSGGGFVFGIVESLLIANLSFMHCGADVSKVVHQFPYVPQQADLHNLTVALGFFLVEDLDLFGVLVQNNTGYGLAALNLLGNSSITGSAFIFNVGDTFHPGGNALLYFMLMFNELQCSQFPEVNLAITSSKFMYGKTPQYASLPPLPPGLRIVLDRQCFQVSIQLKDSILSKNQNNESAAAYHGANLAVDIIHPKGNSGFHNIVIDNCHIEGGRALLGGGIFLYVAESWELRPTEVSCTVNHTNQAGSVHILNTEIVRNAAVDAAAGVGIVLNLCHKYSIKIKNVTMDGNVLSPKVGGSTKGSWQQFAAIGAGNLGIIVAPATPYHSISIANSTFRSGVSRYGGAIVIYTLFPPCVYRARQFSSLDMISLSNVTFTNNTADFGGALWLDLGTQRDPSTVSLYNCQAPPVSVVRVQKCTFANNTGYLGSALAVTSEGAYSTFTDLITAGHVQLIIHNTSFRDHQTPNRSTVLPILNYKLTNATVTRATVYLHSIRNATFASCQFENNTSTGLLAEKSNVFFEGENIFKNNSGVRGGGLILLYSYLYPKLNAKISFINNRASEVGGAMYIKEELSPYGNYPCPLQPDVPLGMPYNESGIAFEFKNNTASDAGASIYGGYFDTCNPSTYKLPTWPIHANPSDTITYDEIFDFTNKPGKSDISSDPIGVCFCDGTLQNCAYKQRTVATFPGAHFNVTVVTVGQRNGPVRGIVRAKFHDSTQLHSLGNLQDSQSVSGYCTNLSYAVFSSNNVEYLKLTIENPSELFDYLYQPPILTIQLSPCPLGFTPRGFPPKCGCEFILEDAGLSCDINTQRVHRPAGIWIGYSNTGITTHVNQSGRIAIHKHCPFDYCIQRDNDIHLETSDEQCESNRSAVLCGQCKQGFSLVLGSNRCRKCENTYLSLLLAFGVAGLALVALLIVCNLTVAEGTLSGLIFYANIVQGNRSSFLPCQVSNTGDKILRDIVCKLPYFTSWLSLNLGIETCFYDGMNMYSKAWLQFVFSVYVWMIVALIIIASHYNTKASRLFGRNSTKVLATLFLLSYAKILNAVFTALSFTFLDYSDDRQIVWLPDGNINYLRGKHIALFILAVIFALAFLVPYTVIVLSIQCLQKRSWYRPLGWVRRLKPLLDAYTGPYKDRYRFWTGLLLLVRFILFLLGALGDASFNVLLTGVAASFLLVLQWAFLGIYRNWLLDVLEGSFLVNIAILSAATLYTETGNGDQTIVAFISMAVSCGTMVGIVIYHVGVRIWNLRCRRNYYREMKVVVTNAQEEDDSSSEDTDQPSEIQPLRLTRDRDDPEGGFIFVPLHD